jgi:hypothetical protein
MHHRMNESPAELDSLHQLVNLSWMMLELSTSEKVDFMLRASFSERKTEKVVDIVPHLLGAARAVFVRARLLTLLRSHQDSDSITSDHLDNELDAFLYAMVDPPMRSREHVFQSLEDAQRSTTKKKKKTGDMGSNDDAGSTKGVPSLLLLTVSKYLHAIAVKVFRNIEMQPFTRGLRILIQLDKYIRKSCVLLQREFSYSLRFRGVLVVSILADYADQWQLLVGERATTSNSAGTVAKIQPENVTMPPEILHSRNPYLQKRDLRRAGKG